MNNNQRNNNNRRRGRGGNRQQGGGGQQLNRIDSRARGNAPQLLEKYRKLAHDAHLNGDRVQEEYFLQFADHYFRVIADQRQRQDEQREQRQQRWEGGDQANQGGQWREDGEDQGEYSGEGEYGAYDQQPGFQRAPRQNQDDRGNRDDRFRTDDGYREERPRQESREPSRDESGEGGEERRPQFESSDNPFVRESRNRAPRPRREDRRPRQNRDEIEAPQLGLDPSSLPPAISAAREDAPADFAAEDGGEADAKPRRRTRKPKPPADDAGEKLEAIT